MQHFLHQAARKRFQHFFGALALGQQFVGALQLGFAPSFRLGLQLADQGHGAALHHPVHKALHPGVNDDLGLRHGRLSVCLTGLHHAGQIVDGVQVDVFQRFDFGLNVTRHCQVDHEHGLALALF